MARKTKAPTRRPSSKKKPSGAKTKAAARTKRAAKPAKATARRKPGSRKGAGTEVERNWASYLAQRTSLEQAVAAVQAAEAELSSARAIEATRRKEFDDSKDSLERLLEVNPASGPASASRQNPRRKPLDFPVPARTPASSPSPDATPS